MSAVVAPTVKLEQAKAKEADVKEVSMDVAAPTQEGGGGGKTRRRRRGGSRRRQKGGAAEEAQQDSGYTATVQKEGDAPAIAPAPTPTPTPTPTPVAPKQQTGGAKKPAPLVVIAPPKKKAPKVTLVPKTTAVAKRAHVKKTFKAKRVRVLIKNRKTIKRQQQALQKVDTMTEDAIRKAAVSAGLTRADANAPVELLRTMLKDYQTMKGGFL